MLFDDLGYVGDIVPHIVVPMKQLKKFIKMHLLVSFGSKDARKVIIGK